MILFGKKLIVFYKEDLSGELTPICGSDGIFIPDQRWGINRMIEEGIEHAKKMLLRRPGALRVEIWKDYSDKNICLTDLIKI